MTNEETIAKTAHYLKNLPSRRIHRDRGMKIKTESETSKDDGDDETTSSLNTFEERMRDERRAEVRRRFRYVEWFIYSKMISVSLKKSDSSMQYLSNILIVFLGR